MNNNSLFASGFDFRDWTPVDWAVAISGGFAVYTAVAAFALSIRRLR
jgi:hypothetical protein